MIDEHIKLLKNCFNNKKSNPLRRGEVLWWGIHRADGGSQVNRIAMGPNRISGASESAYLEPYGYVRLKDTAIHFFCIVDVDTKVSRPLRTSNPTKPALALDD